MNFLELPDRRCEAMEKMELPWGFLCFVGFFLTILQNLRILTITDLSLMLLYMLSQETWSNCIPLEVTTLLFNLELAIYFIKTWIVSNNKIGGRKEEGVACFSVQLFHASVSCTRLCSSFQHLKHHGWQSTWVSKGSFCVERCREMLKFCNSVGVLKVLAGICGFFVEFVCFNPFHHFNFLSVNFTAWIPNNSQCCGFFFKGVDDTDSMR